MKEIFSKQNQKIKELKKQKQKNRFLLFLDNQKSIIDAQKFGLCPKLCLVDKEKTTHFDFLQAFENQGVEVIATSAEIIKDFSQTQTPQGIVCVFEFLPKPPCVPQGNFLVLDGLQDAGNVGTLIRSALGANFCTVFLVDCVALSNPKLVRSTMASIFALDNVIEISRTEFAKFAVVNNLPLVCADMHGQSVFDFAPNGQVGLVVGSEGQGVSEELSSLCQKTVSIPMSNNLESLNAGVAGSIIMFEVKRRSEL